MNDRARKVMVSHRAGHQHHLVTMRHPCPVDRIDQQGRAKSTLMEIRTSDPFSNNA